jgi:hypothetical protein
MVNAESRNEMTETGHRCLPSFSVDDPSFILSPDAPYLANLAALWAVDPKLAARIEATHGSASYPVQLARSGVPTVSVLVGGSNTRQSSLKLSGAVESRKNSVALSPSPGTPGEGSGGGLDGEPGRGNPHPNPPSEYRGR